VPHQTSRLLYEEHSSRVYSIVGLIRIDLQGGEVRPIRRSATYTSDREEPSKRALAALEARISRDVEVQHLASVMVDDQKAIQNPEGERRHGEEVHRRNGLTMVSRSQHAMSIRAEMLCYVQCLTTPN
jgi:hypothetical protein